MIESLERCAAGTKYVGRSAAAALEGVDMKIGERSASLHFDHTLLAELSAQSWKQNHPHFTLNERSRGAWLQASWWRPPGHRVMEMHWSRRAARVASADLLPFPPAASDGAA
jgi:hypothetical protein